MSRNKFSDPENRITADSIPPSPPLRVPGKIPLRILAFPMNGEDIVRWVDFHKLGREGLGEHMKYHVFHKNAGKYLPRYCLRAYVDIGKGRGERIAIVVATNNSQESLDLAQDIESIERVRVELQLAEPPRWFRSIG
ncbi:hypothetical protein BD779DRAFT_1478930 [Infundibulicybe gibba]|nr:hypothetical protein BD779DRAFT_1478930 [Infundibulicybe gibba]